MPKRKDPARDGQAKTFFRTQPRGLVAWLARRNEGQSPAVGVSGTSTQQGRLAAVPSPQTSWRVQGSFRCLGAERAQRSACQAVKSSARASDWTSAKIVIQDDLGQIRM